MPTPIDREEVQRLVRAGAQLVEVLPEPEYTWAHLPGARNLPLRDLTREAAQGLDHARPVLVYCNDFV